MNTEKVRVHYSSSTKHSLFTARGISAAGLALTYRGPLVLREGGPAASVLRALHVDPTPRIMEGTADGYRPLLLSELAARTIRKLPVSTPSGRSRMSMDIFDFGAAATVR